MCFLASGTYLFHLFSFFACVPLPPAHTYFIISPSLACIFHITTRMFPMYVYFLQTNLLKNNAIIQIIEVKILKYPTQSCVTKWLKEKLIFELIFWIVVLNYCSELLFWVIVKKLGKYKYFPKIKAIYYLSKITRWW